MAPKTESPGPPSPEAEGLPALIGAYLSGTASDEQVEALSDRLRRDDAARTCFLGHSDLHACLHADESLWSEPVREFARPPADEVGRAPGVFSRTAIAVSLAFGILAGAVGTGVAWALSSPATIVTIRPLSLLMHGGFETSEGRLAFGFPRELGVWSGDEAEIVSTKVAKGSRTLRFVRASGDAAVPNSPARSCDVFQLVDLRTLRGDAAPHDATLEVSAKFLDAREAGAPPVTFTCRLYVFSGSPDALQSEWPLTRTEALAMGSGQVECDGGSPAAWRVVTAKLLLPATADFAVVQLVVGQPRSGAGEVVGEVAEFGEQFADDVELTLRSQPASPVRRR